MKRFMIALFAIALLSGAPLLAQTQDDPTMDDSTTQLQAQTPEEQTGLQDQDMNDDDVDVDVDADADFNADADLDADNDLDTDSDELPATGSELPLAALLGFGALAGAAVLRLRS